MRINMLKVFMLAAIVMFAGISCRDKDAEKRIAELEGRLAEIEGKKTAQPVKDASVPAASPKAEKPEGPLPTAEFAQIEYDFGSIKEGQIVEHTFEVKNNGEAPLIISKAAPSCGCTVPDWTKTPIPVGGTGFVKAKFDSNGKPGMQNKTITVTTNAWPTQTVLRFKAMVAAKAKSDGSEGPVQ